MASNASKAHPDPNSNEDGGPAHNTTLDVSGERLPGADQTRNKGQALREPSGDQLTGTDSYNRETVRATGSPVTAGSQKSLSGLLRFATNWTINKQHSLPWTRQLPKVYGRSASPTSRQQLVCFCCRKARASSKIWGGSARPRQHTTPTWMHVIWLASAWGRVQYSTRRQSGKNSWQLIHRANLPRLRWVTSLHLHTRQHWACCTPRLPTS